MRLFEFERSSSGRNNTGFYKATLDFAKSWPARAESWGTGYTPSLAKEESKELKTVANAFIEGIEQGATAFYELDTLIRDELCDYWEEVGLDPELVLDQHSRITAINQASRKPINRISGFDNWKSQLLQKYPTARIEIPDLGTELEKLKKLYPAATNIKPSNNINAYVNGESVGQYITDLDTGVIR